MKKFFLIVIPLVVIGALSGVMWWKYGRSNDPYAVAQQLMDRGDLKGAQLLLRNVLRTSPQNSGAHYRLGQVAQRLGDPVAAEKELKAARELGFDPRTVNPLLAQAYMAQARYKDLLRDFTPQGLAADQASPLLVLRAMAQVSLNDTAAAMTSSTEAERLTPQSPEAAMATARVAIASHDFVLAEQKVERALVLNPRNTDALILKGQLLNLKGDRLRAVEAFDSAIALNPNLVAARLERANLLLLNDQPKRAREDVDMVLKVEPRSAMGIFLKSVLLVKAEDYAAADVELTRISALLPRFPRGYMYQAITKYNLGQAEQASDAAERFLSHNADDPDAIKLFARIELAARRSTRAIAVLNKAIEGGATDPEMLDLLGRAYALAGKPELAMQSMERAAALAPDNADILTRLASVRMSMGDMSRAAGDLEHALQIAPNQAGAGEQLVVAAISAGETDKAAVALERLRKVQGESEAVGNLAALIRLAQLDLDGAGAQLLDVIKRFPDAIQPRINLAKVLVLRDKSGEAEIMLSEVLKRQPTEPTALNNIVGLLVGSSKASQALAILQAAHASAPKNPDVTVQLANLYIRLGETRKGLDLAELVLKDQPENTALMVAKARLQMALGQSTNAVTTYRQVLELNPADSETRQALAALLVSTKQGDAARALLNDGLQASPGEAALLQAYVSVVYQTDGLDPALAAADAFARDQKNLPQARTLRGDVYMASGHYADAATAYAVELRADPSNTLVVRLVNALNASGRSEQATQTLRDWLNSNPSDVTIASALAGMDISSRRFFDAETHLQVVLARRPSDSDALNNLAWVYQQRGDARARPIAQKAYLLDPSPQTADTLGWILTTQGNAATGLALLRQAAGQIGGDPTIQYHLAVALRDTARRDEAIQVLRPIVQGLVDFDDRQAATKLLQELQQG